MTMQKQAFPVCVLILTFVQESVTFLPNHFDSGSAPDDLTHADITEMGILRAAAEFFERRPAPGHTSLPIPHSLTGIQDITTRKLYTAYYGSKISDTRFKDTIDDIVDNSNKVNIQHASDAVYHFNGEKIKEANRLLLSLRESLIYILNAREPNYDAAREVVGQYLHTLQMFYCNTNWIELYGNRIYKDLGIPGRPLMDIATEDQATCRECRSQKEPCFENLLNIGPVLTSGYKSSQDVEKPRRDPKLYSTGKCSHGGIYDESAILTPMGGINKETGNPAFSPHFHLHQSAGLAAIEHTRYFFTDPNDGLLSVIGDDKFQHLLQLQPGTALVFVIDSIFSHEQEANATKSKIREIIMETYGTIYQPYEYVLVLFTDQDLSSTVKRTQNAKEMIKWMDNIKPHQWNMTTESFNANLQTAVVVAQPYSRLLIFTESSLTEIDNVEYIASLITDKHLVTDFIITDVESRQLSTSQQQGRDSHRVKRSLQIWTIPTAVNNLATISSGHVYQSSKTNINNTVNVIKNALSTSEIVVMRLHLSGGNAGFSTIDIPVDETMNEMKIMIDGITAPPSFTLTEPYGNIIVPGMHVNTSLNTIGSYAIIYVRSPTPGKWKLHRTNILTWELEVRGQSTLQFTSKLMTTSSNGYANEITGRPIAGDNLTVLITINDFTRCNQVDQLLLLDEKGQLIDNVKLSNISSKRNRGVLRSNVVIPVAQYFQFAIDGYDTAANPFRRLQTTMISPVSIKLVTNPLSGPFYINSNLAIPYTVTNLGAGLAEIAVEMKDDKGFTVAPSVKKHLLAANANANGSFLLHAGSTIGETTTVTVSAQPSFIPGANFQFVILHVTTVNGTAPVDTTPPVCNLGKVTGQCASKPLCDCNITYATAEAEVWDEGLGLKQIVSNGTGTDFNLTYIPFTPGLIKSVGTVKANLRVNCCRKEAYIVVTDLNGNTSQCVVQVNSNWKPNGCIITTSPDTTSMATTEVTTDMTTEMTTDVTTQSTDITTAAVKSTAGQSTSSQNVHTTATGNTASSASVTTTTGSTTTGNSNTGNSNTGNSNTGSSTSQPISGATSATQAQTTQSNDSSSESSEALSTTQKALIGAGAGTLGLAAIVTGGILLKKKYTTVSPD